jgi:hypothetical protein
MSRKLAIRYQEIRKELDVLDKKRMAHMNAWDRIYKKQTALRDEMKQIEPEVFAWQENELRELEIKFGPKESKSQ